MGSVGSLGLGREREKEKTMALVKHYKELHIYHVAFESAVRIFELSKSWPWDDKSLTDQIRRSSRSVCGNMAEAWRKRRFPKHFVSKLSDADQEAAETQVWLDFAYRHGYIEKADHDEVYRTYDSVCAGLVHMMEAPEKWCGPSQLVREERAEYLTDANE